MKPLESQVPLSGIGGFNPAEASASPQSGGATLLVMCDLACNWKLDGKARGRIAAGSSATALALLGEHLVIATTEDGLDTVQQLIEVKNAGQKVLTIELKPIVEARENAIHKQREKALEEAAEGVWTDTTTGLMWTKRDNGTDLDWKQALAYCRDLRLASHADWRLPTLGELGGIFDPEVADKSGRHVKGNLELSGWQWSSSLDYNTGKVQGIGFDHGNQDSFAVGSSTFSRALCVRRSGE